MQAVTAAQCFAALPARRVARKAVRAVARPVVAKASAGKAPLAAAAASAASLLVAHPALALVDERMNGDGAGLILGLNDGGLFINMFIIFIGVWALYWTSQKDLGGDDGEDSGLSL